jgi:hypothetical protein
MALQGKRPGTAPGSRFSLWRSGAHCGKRSGGLPETLRNSLMHIEFKNILTHGQLEKKSTGWVENARKSFPVSRLGHCSTWNNGEPMPRLRPPSLASSPTRFGRMFHVEHSRKSRRGPQQAHLYIPRRTIHCPVSPHGKCSTWNIPCRESGTGPCMLAPAQCAKSSQGFVRRAQ